MPGKQFHNIFSLVALSGIGFFLPLSEYLISVFIILLVINWIVATARFGIKGAIAGQPAMLVFFGAYFVYLAWMAGNDNLQAGLHDLRLKLPMLILPLVIASSEKPGEKRMGIILYSFVAGVIISSFAGVITFFGSSETLLDHRDLSPFISHIRLSLMMVLAIFIMVRDVKPGHPLFTRKNIVATLIIAWLIFFMFLLYSLTGILILLLGAWVSILRRSISLKRKVAVLLSVIIPAVVLAMIVSGLFVMYNRFSHPVEETTPLEGERTLSGNDYVHYPERLERENGFYVWRYICEPELEVAWNSISSIDYNGKDGLGHEIRFTLIRYLSSMGSRKDSAGVAGLSQDDIRLIERGYANRRYLDGTGIGDRIYEIFWQIDYYRNGGNPQGHSLTQRIEYLGNGWRVFKRFPVFGTGTGDLVDQVAEQYITDRTMLDNQFRRIPHNQYLTSLATFGIAGFIIFWMTLVLPAFMKRGFRDNLFTIFFLIAFASMLWEDTLETHTGVTFFAYFYSLLLFYKQGEDYDGTDRKEPAN